MWPVRCSRLDVGSRGLDGCGNTRSMNDLCIVTMPAGFPIDFSCCANVTEARPNSERHDQVGGIMLVCKSRAREAGRCSDDFRRTRSGLLRTRRDVTRRKLLYRITISITVTSCTSATSRSQVLKSSPRPEPPVMVLLFPNPTVPTGRSLTRSKK